MKNISYLDFLNLSFNFFTLFYFLNINISYSFFRKALPWTLDCLYRGPFASVLENGCPLIDIAVALIVFIATVFIFRFRLRKVFGIPLLITYILFLPIFFVTVYEYLPCLV